MSTGKSHIAEFLDKVWDLTEERLKSCIEEVARFQSLVASVETLHEADSPPATISAEPIDLRDAIRPVIGMFASRCTSANLNLLMHMDDIPVWIVSSPTLVSCVEYTEQCGEIHPQGGTI